MMETVDEYVLSLKRQRFSENFDAYLLETTSSAMLQSIRGHYYTIISEMSDLEAANEEEFTQSFSRLWGVLNSVYGVETQEDLEGHIEKVEQEVERFYEESVEPNVS